jgi:hypothetical protein
MKGPSARKRDRFVRTAHNRIGLNWKCEHASYVKYPGRSIENFARRHVSFGENMDLPS